MARLARELPLIFGPDLVAIWLYGGQLRAPGTPGDLDGHVVLAGEASRDQLTRVRAVHASLQRDFTIHEVDVWYVLRSEAECSEPPRDVNWHEEARDENWALKRAHWFAGAYALVFGLRPTDVVPEPAWSEVERELFAQVDRAREVTRWLPVLTLRLCRVVRTLVTRDVLLTKLDSAAALMPELSPVSRAHVEAAVRAYRGEDLPGDAGVLSSGAAGFYSEICSLVGSAR
jgi:hypothetical protein